MRGHIHKRLHTTKAGRQTVNWYVVVDLLRASNGRRRQKWHGGYATRREAEAVRAKIVHELNAGSHVEPSTVTLAEWVHEEWLPSVQWRVKPSTFHSYQRNLELHVLPPLGSHRLAGLTAPMLNAMYRELLADGHQKQPGGLSLKTVRYVHTIVHKVLADAVDAGLIAVNVAERSKPPRISAGPATEMRFWTPQELGVFLELVRGHRLEAAWNVAAMTGMRRGEVIGLRWRDLDVDAARISVRQALISVAGETIVSTPKNHQARVVDLDAGTNDLLRSHRVAQQVERDEWGTDYHDTGLVFCREDGTHVRPGSLSYAFGHLIAGTSLPRIRFHDLRHTHATIAVRAGIPIKVIAERLGHQNPAFTMTQYAHVMPGMQAEAARIVATTVRDAVHPSSTAVS